jgi:hypothetical protein
MKRSLTGFTETLSCLMISSATWEAIELEFGMKMNTFSDTIDTRAAQPGLGVEIYARLETVVQPSSTIATRSMHHPFQTLNMLSQAPTSYDFIIEACGSVNSRHLTSQCSSLGTGDNWK